MDRLQWPGADNYKNASRNPIWENNQLEGYSKSYGNLRFFWINVAGHSVSSTKLKHTTYLFGIGRGKKGKALLFYL